MLDPGKQLTVLVTGAGGVYGEATVANLRHSALPVFIWGADTRWNGSGALCADRPLQLPLIGSPDYIPRLVSHIRQYHVNAVFICSGAEIKALAPQRDVLERETGATFILPDASLYHLCSDKFQTVELLSSKGFDYPNTILSSEFDKITPFIAEVGFPFIAKPRYGQGSRGIRLCQSPQDAEDIASIGEEYVFQELIGDDDHEYTVGVVATETGDVLSSIVLRRWLKHGQTLACEVVVDKPLISEYSEAIARELRPRGYVNIQLRLRRDRPVAFEINGRVSSSTGFRRVAGVNEPELILRYYLFGEKPPRPIPQPVAMVRGWQESIVSPEVWAAAAPAL
jgi:carbamoyl-phosphate synthase large subunit